MEILKLILYLLEFCCHALLHPLSCTSPISPSYKVYSAYVSNNPKQLFSLVLIVLKSDFDQYLRHSSHTNRFIFPFSKYFADTVLCYRIEVP